MNIVHICLAAFYVEGFGYQENILPQFHVQMGNNVMVITSDYAFNNKYEAIKKKDTDYINKFGVHVKVLSKNDSGYLRKRIKNFCGLYDELKKQSPDVIFVHGGQFYSLKDVIKYCQKNKGTKLYIDQHADYYNCPVSSLKSKIIQKIIFGHYMRKAAKYTNKFWGVTPWRCQFLHDVYRIPKNKIELLLMGGDDRYIHMDKKEQIRFDIRTSLKINESDFVIATGGKIDKAKNIDMLMEAVCELNDSSIKLIVFGSVADDVKQEFERILNHSNNVIYIGWLDSDKVYDYFLASDLACFPGTHSVLWEQACACKIPCLFKHWEGMEHVNNGGNSDFISPISEEAIREKIVALHFTDKYYQMKSVAESDATDIYLYSKIAEKSIECCDVE